MFRFAMNGAVCTVLAAVAVSCTPLDGAAAKDGAGLRGFASERELDSFASKMAELGRRQVVAEFAMEEPAPAPMMVTGSRAEPESITNTQEAGVDEGGIVKNAGDYLVVLRRGRVFTVRTGGDALEPVDAIDAFPPGKQNPGDTWYDEMLVYGDQVVVIGYSYGDFGTEVNQFRLGGDGRLTYRDTHYLRSGDYYSSSNYASRLIGDELIFYAPLFFDWTNWRERLPALRKRGESGPGERLVAPEDFYVAEPYRSARFPIEVLHAVTRCDLSAPELDCEAKAVAGTWSHAFYVSPEAVYVWTGAAHRRRYDDESPATPGQLYRLPLDGGRPGAVAVQGSPSDQFAFAEDASDRVLRVVLREDGYGEGMWAGEYSRGDIALVTVPLARFGNGAGRLAQTAYRKLPPVEGYRLHNRFVGDWLLYAAADYGEEVEQSFLYAVPLERGEPERIALRHGVTRFDVLGRDGVAIGPGPRDALGFSAIALGRTARLEDTYLLPSAGEGETRSQAFFYRPDRSSDDGVSGTLALPVTRELDRPGAEFLGSGSSIFFLRRDDRRFSPAGELVARTADTRPDGCIASCVDWYGNARPIFLGERVFALMGYELVEGRLEGGRIREVRRINFAPRGRERG